MFDHHLDEGGHIYILYKLSSERSDSDVYRVCTYYIVRGDQEITGHDSFCPYSVFKFYSRSIKLVNTTYTAGFEASPLTTDERSLICVRNRSLVSWRSDLHGVSSRK